MVPRVIPGYLSYGEDMVIKYTKGVSIRVNGNDQTRVTVQYSQYE